MIDRIEDCLIVFPHTERTGGSTIHTWFSGINKNNWFYAVDTASGTSIDQITSSCEKSCSGYLGGHFSLTDFEKSLCAKRCINKYIFSICRNPIERFISVYKLWKKRPEWLPHVNNNWDFNSADALYTLYQQMSFSNRTCKQLSPLGTFESVVDIIGKKIAFIGITDRMDLIAKQLMTDLEGYWPDSYLYQCEQIINAGALVDNNELEKLGFLKSELIERITNDNIEDERLFKYILKQGGICNSLAV